MTKTYREGAIGALLDEYEKAIRELQQTIADLTAEELTTIVDAKTHDSRCRSVQTILSHVVNAGKGYAVYILRNRGEEIPFPENILHAYVRDYQKDLDELFSYTLETFKQITESEIEQFENEKKIKTAWGQVYDIEQLTEHAIVHILRHRRQIEKFKRILR